MIVADTSVWIEYLRLKPDYVVFFEAPLSKGKLTATSFVFGELLQGCRKSADVDRVLELYQDLPHLNEDDVWLEAGSVSQKEKWFAAGVGLIDAALIIAARRANAKIWTLDKKLKSVLKLAEVYEPVL